ncbi:MAG: hypothetical protein RIS35_3037 [Pseudomonadota bacterium]
MGNFVKVLAVALTSFALLASHAEAARLGGGKSSGRQSSNVTERQAMPQQPGQASTAPAQQAQPAAPRQAPAAQPQASGARRWLGPLAGLAAGLGLAALASHLGFGEELASMMLIALLAVAAIVVVRMIMARRNSQRPAMQTAYSSAGVGPEASVRYAPLPDAPMSGTSAAPSMPASLDTASPAAASGSWRIPEGFDSEGFVRNAKVQFIRLQAAYDSANIDDLREFTTPALFAELRMQLNERGQTPNRTDVVQLEAEILGIETDSATHLASIRFHGLIRETEGGAAESFDEVWNLEKPVSGQSGWLLAGIQQLH